MLRTNGSGETFPNKFADKLIVQQTTLLTLKSIVCGNLLRTTYLLVVDAVDTKSSIVLFAFALSLPVELYVFLPVLESKRHVVYNAEHMPGLASGASSEPEDVGDSSSSPVISSAGNEFVGLKLSGSLSCCSFKIELILNFDSNDVEPIF
uniref:Uncharacterized protein n=1 Tax=Glossina brevipalpis TaxID=37001 RepID=A0A1A9X375_9MUSC